MLLMNLVWSKCLVGRCDDRAEGLPKPTTSISTCDHKQRGGCDRRASDRDQTQAWRGPARYSQLPGRLRLTGSPTFDLPVVDRGGQDGRRFKSVEGGH